LKRKDQVKNQELFGEWQTELYKPPLVGENDPIPKNIHGNIDVFTENMIPLNCVWIKNLVAKEIANDLNIGFADACVGFKFHGGKAIPKIYGIIIKASDKIHLEQKIKEYEFRRIKESLKEEEDISKKNWIKVFSIIINNREYSTDIKKETFSSILIDKNENSYEDFDII
jgi:hypothetical protein